MKGYENEVVCIGSTAMDLMIEVDSLPSPDQISLAAWTREFCGGSSANVAVGLARLGVHAGLISKVGRDREGVTLLSRLISEGVDIRFVNTVGKTSKTIVLLSERGEKTIVADTAGILSSKDRVPLQALHGAQALYIGECYLSLAEKALGYTQKKDILSFLRLKNIHFSSGLDPTGMIFGADFVLMNEKTYAVFSSHISNPPENLIVTRGNKGCAVPSRNIIIEGLPVNAVDTTGAGDAFSAAFIHGLISSDSLEKALQVANTAAAFSTTVYGAMDSMPTTGQVQSMI
jgi:ribokinase